MDGELLAEFLRARRAVARPADNPPGSLPRVSGLRRDEVAELAAIPVDYYTQLEQNPTSTPPAEVVTALAAALGLSQAQSAHLYRLTDHPVPASLPRAQRADPALLRILHQLDRAPAHVITDLGETLAQNRLSLALFGDDSRHTGAARSLYHRWFTDPAGQQLFAEDQREQESQTLVAELRATLARRSDAPARDLVQRLRTESPGFAARWDDPAVTERAGDRKLLLGPTGPLELHSQALTAAGGPGQLLVVLTPVPGTDAADHLARL